MKFGCEVVSTTFHTATESWTIIYRDSSHTIHTITSPYLVVCCGFLSTPVTPSIPGIDTFPGTPFLFLNFFAFPDSFLHTGRVIHSEEYSSPAPYTSQRVLVVGNSFSGADICCEISSVAHAHTHNAVRGAKWIFPREIQTPAQSQPLPVDLLFYSRQSAASKLGKTQIERNIGTNGWFASVLDIPSDVHPLLQTPRGEDPVVVSITDEYLACVRRGDIKLHPALVRFDGNSAVFEDGSSVEVDSVIFATGYKPNVEFLMRQNEDSVDLDGLVDLQELLEYKPEDMLLPIVLYMHTLHPSLPSLGFVGMYKVWHSR